MAGAHGPATIVKPRIDSAFVERFWSYDSFGVLSDDTLLWAIDIRDKMYLFRSSDGAQTWSDAIQLDSTLYPSAGDNANCITELADGTVVWPTRLGPKHKHVARITARGAVPGSDPQPFWTTYVFRSTDGGRTWPQKFKTWEWTTETNLLSL